MNIQLNETMVGHDRLASNVSGHFDLTDRFTATFDDFDALSNGHTDAGFGNVKCTNYRGGAFRKHDIVRSI